MCLLKPEPHYRREAFESGLKRLGYGIHGSIRDVRPNDVLVIWNRMGGGDAMARLFESRGATVLVAENGYLGNEFAGRRWYALSRSHHNGAGYFPVGDNSRWDDLGVELQPWARKGRHILLLPQRGIGEKGVAMPNSWTDHAYKTILQGGGLPRVRHHPGTKPCLPLDEDLRNDVGAVATWGSGAALKALLLGYSCYYSFPKWIGAAACDPLEDFLLGENDPREDSVARLAMFRRLAWGMATLEEIEDGSALDRLING